MTKGVYGIYHGEECLYVGQSVCIERRWRKHRAALADGRHHTPGFSPWFTASGLSLEDLTFTILTDLGDGATQLELNLEEIRYFNLLRPRFYGKTPSEGNSYGVAPEVIAQAGKTASERYQESYTGVSYIDEETGVRMRVMRCPTCNKEFSTSKRRQFYCTLQCRPGNQRHEKECLHCGEDFIAVYEATRYCHGCKYLVRSVELTCATCHEDFTARDTRKKYCSRECKRNVPVEKTCTSCGAVGTWERRYRQCKECRSKVSHRSLRSKPRKVSCGHCEKPFTPEGRGMYLYCSTPCREAEKEKKRRAKVKKPRESREHPLDVRRDEIIQLLHGRGSLATIAQNVDATVKSLQTWIRTRSILSEVEFICRGCGAGFHPTVAKHRSNCGECRSTAPGKTNGPRVKKMCSECPGEVAPGRSKTCSEGCARLRILRRQGEYNRDVRVKNRGKCAVCPRSVLSANPSAETCSKSCAAVFSNRRRRERREVSEK